MVKIDIISGFLGAGKTTLINRLINEIYKGEKIVLIENEFGEIGIDSGFLKDSGIQISEMNSGCICCSLVGDFSEALKQVVADYSPERIIIEPSGVGKLSDVTKAVIAAELEGAVINSSITVVDVNKCKMYMKNFGEFFNDQIVSAECVLLSHTDKTTEAKLAEALALIRSQNDKATVITTPAALLSAENLAEAIEGTAKSFEEQLKDSMEDEVCPVCHEHHHHGEHHHPHDDEECHCHEHHHDEHHHHHHDGEECHCHEHHHEEHHHHHHDGEECHCHEHHHEEHHHHHHADDVFTSWGRETVKRFSADEIKAILNEFANEEKFGIVLRAKGIVQGIDDKWIHFDYVPGEADVRFGSPEHIGKLCVIGSKINETNIAAAFGV